MPFRETALTSNPDLAATSRFPISASEVERTLSSFAGFTAEQVDLITGINGQHLDPTTPLGHMWDFREDSGIWTAMTRYARPAPPFPEVPEPFWRYRAAACIGDIVMRGHEDNLRMQGRKIVPVKFDPFRHYLVYPEKLENDAVGRYAREQHTGQDLTDLYAGNAVNAGYFNEHDAVRAVHALRDAWLERKMEYLLPAANNKDFGRLFFGELCRGMFQTFRLYRIGEHEGYLAPWDDLYDEAKHFLMEDDAPVRIPEILKCRRRWVDGRDIRLPGSDAIEEIWDDTFPVGSTITSVRRCIRGFVPMPDQPDEFVTVGFKKSVETFALEQNDIIIIENKDGAFTQLRYPFKNSMEDEEDWGYRVMALCRNGRAIPLRDPGLWNYDLYAAIDETLSGGSVLYDLGAERMANL